MTPENIDRTLAANHSPIRHFRADLNTNTVRHIDDWLTKLTTRGVESLTLQATFGTDFFSFQPCAFAFDLLTSLDLTLSIIPHLPDGFMGFPNLTKLVLDFAQFAEIEEYDLQEIIARSPLL